MFQKFDGEKTLCLQYGLLANPDLPPRISFGHMHVNFGAFWNSLHHMSDTFIGRLPSFMIAVVVFLCFYILSKLVGRVIRRATRGHRANLGMVFARLISAAVVMFGLLVGLSVVAPSFQASDLIKVLGIGSVAIGFAFQNILQNFLAGLLLLW